MPEHTKFAQMPIPLDSETDRVPAAMKAALSVADSQLVLRAKDSADRDDRYSDAPAGTLVVCTDDPSLYYRDAEKKWRSLTEQETKKTTIESWGPNFEDKSTDGSYMRRVGSMAELFVHAEYSGEDIEVPSDGHMADITICTVPSDLRPHSGLAVFDIHGGSPFAGMGVVYQSSGSVNLTVGYPNTKLAAGRGLYIQTMWTV